MNKEVCMRCMNAGWSSGWTVFDEEQWNDDNWVACPAALNKGHDGLNTPDSWLLQDGPHLGCHFLLEHIIMGQEDMP